MNRPAYILFVCLASAIHMKDAQGQRIIGIPGKYARYTTYEKCALGCVNDRDNMQVGVPTKVQACAKSHCSRLPMGEGWVESWHTDEECMRNCFEEGQLHWNQCLWVICDAYYIDRDNKYAKDVSTYEECATKCFQDKDMATFYYGKNKQIFPLTRRCARNHCSHLPFIWDNATPEVCIRTKNA